jgi:hypothetical protein
MIDSFVASNPTICRNRVPLFLNMQEAAGTTPESTSKEEFACFLPGCDI